MITISGDGFVGLISDGRLNCPGCGGRLIRWGWDRVRLVYAAVDGKGLVWRVRRRRVRCKECGVTHVVQSPALVAGHRDAAHVIQAAFDLMAGGFGFRVAARLLKRPVSTARDWFRAARRQAPWTVGLAGPAP